jgi:pyruvate formate lyase activating enzyme
VGVRAPVKAWLETSLLDWPGKVAAVVFLPGCNFRCPFCHNHRLVTAPGEMPDIPLDDILTRLGDLAGWVDGVVVSGGEPTLHQGLPDLLRTFRAAGLLVKLDTNGSRPDVLARLLAEGLVDHVAMDVKAPLEPERYARLAGREVDLEAIRASIRIIRSSGLPHTFRTTAVPGWHAPGDMESIAALLPGSAHLVQSFRPGETLLPDLSLPPS